MNQLVTLDAYTFAVLLIAVLVLGVMLGIVGSPFMGGKPAPAPYPRTLYPREGAMHGGEADGDPEPEYDPRERHWLKRGPGGR